MQKRILSSILTIILAGCAAPGTPYQQGGITFHPDDLSKCERGATGCFTGQDVYYSTLDPGALPHEKDHVAGMRHGEWKTEGYEVCAPITAQGNTQWLVGKKMCRQAGGTFVMR